MRRLMKASLWRSYNLLWVIRKHKGLKNGRKYWKKEAECGGSWDEGRGTLGISKRGSWGRQVSNGLSGLKGCSLDRAGGGSIFVRGSPRSKSTGSRKPSAPCWLPFPWGSRWGGRETFSGVGGEGLVGGRKACARRSRLRSVGVT